MDEATTQSSAPEETVVYRPYKESDKNFILASWLRGLYYADAGILHLMPKDKFMAGYHRVLEYLLAQPNTHVRIACLGSDPDTILGYSVVQMKGDDACLAWVFVKSAFRKAGIARGLVPINTVCCSHLTKVGLSLLKKFPGVYYDPFF